VTTDWNCARKRFLQYEYDGKGIVSGNTHLELFMGSALHEGLAAIARDEYSEEKIGIDNIATTAHDVMTQSLLANTNGEVEEVDFAQEQATLVEGLLRGFYKHVWFNLMHQYPNILHIEEEMKYEHDGLVFMSKPDLIVADRDGNAIYVEYKSTSSKKEGWVNSWATAVQLHSTIRAIKATTGLDIQQVLVQGLYKGFESYGKQSSPFCYAYKRAGTPPFSHDEIQYAYKAGFKRYPVWEMAGGAKSWVEGMPPQILGEQFPQAPPIFVKDDLINAFFEQRKFREMEIQLAMQMMEHADEESKAGILNVAFPQKFSECHSYFNKTCEFLKICHGHVEDPLKEGFIWREPHHQLELEQFNETIKYDPAGNSNTIVAS
jgi:hypothetical protein